MSMARVATVFALVAVLLAGRAAAAPPQELVVFEAASLKDVVRAAGRQRSRRHTPASR